MTTTPTGPDVEYDVYGEVINRMGTFVEIAATLLSDGSALVGWTDEQSTHLDVLFVLGPRKYGNIQRGLHRSEQLLFVSVIGFGTFGFDVFDRHDVLHPDYVGEKLGLGENVTSLALAILINNVIELVAR